MFNALRSPSPSPCPSPVRDLAAALKRSPKRDKYQSFIGSQEPRISKGRLTMTGGFSDFRPRPLNLERYDSLDSYGTPSISSSSRSESSDSSDPIVDPLGASKSGCRYVKVPRKALKSVIGHLSPRLSKKLMQIEKKEREPVVHQPMWPNVMTTYARGISTSPVQTLVMNAEPSLTAMKARALLDDRRNVRTALELLASQGHLQLQLPLGGDTSSLSSSCSSDQEDSDGFCDSPTRAKTGDKVPPSKKPRCEKLIQLDSEDHIAYPDTSAFPINPSMSVPGLYKGEDQCSTSSEEELFQDEPIFEALDLESLPTIAPEELLKNTIAEVRNIHVTCDYIVLETAPSSESVFV